MTPGADYEVRQASIIKGETFNTIAAGQTRYFVHSLDSIGTNTGAFIMPCDYTIIGMYCKSVIGPGVGETNTFTLNINGANQAMQVVLTGVAAPTVGNDFANPFTGNAGDSLCIEIVTSNLGAYTVTRHYFSLLVKCH